MHLTFSNISHAHLFTLETAHIHGNFEKITCFLFKSKIFVFSCWFSPIRILCGYLSVWLNFIFDFFLCLVLFFKLGLSLALWTIDLSSKRFVSSIKLTFIFLLPIKSSFRFILLFWKSWFWIPKWMIYKIRFILWNTLYASFGMKNHFSSICWRCWWTELASARKVVAFY